MAVSLLKCFVITFLFINCAHAEEVDEFDDALVDTLKIEANHNLNRLKSFKSEISNNKVFENEREKALGEFLEDQEKWDLLRERGLRDNRKQKKEYSSPTENSPEYTEYLKLVAAINKAYEKGRETHVKTRDQILNYKTNDIVKLESEELALYSLRPRYEIRKRARNKWITAGGKSSGGNSGGSVGYTPPPPPITNDYQPPPDFPAAPAPYE
ncbi:MAG: hypothetical protein ABL930_12060, partial [Pseudobdellovibrio sp.]